jgi:hypothetical protein
MNYVRVMAVAVMALAAALPLLADEGEGEALPEKVELTLDVSSQTLKVTTPLRAAKGGVSFHVSGDSGTVDICGKTFKVAAVSKYPVFGLHIDGDGDGKAGRGESENFRRGTTSATFRIELDGVERPVTLGVDNLNISYKTRKVLSFNGDFCPGWSMKGRVGNEEFRLIDANLDGKYTQNGEDAIAIGRSGFALPLQQIHDIDGKRLKLDVAADGKTVGLAATEDVERGRVTAAYPRGLLKSLVLVGDDGQSYDIVEARESGIPAGRYRLSYGVLAKGRGLAFILPSTTTYDIQAGGVNTLKLGEPITLNFGASAAGDKITVSPYTKVVGAGGETYRFLGEAAKPKVAFLVGKRKVAGGSFAEG